MDKIIEVLAGIWANDLYRKIILTIVIMLVGMVLRRIFLFLVHNRISDDNPHIYPISKVTGYMVSILIAILLFAVWVQQIGGWTFTVDDRIETGGNRGDVIDIGLLRTTVMKIENWLNGDHNAGCIVTVRRFSRCF